MPPPIIRTFICSARLPDSYSLRSAFDLTFEMSTVIIRLRGQGPACSRKALGPSGANRRLVARLVEPHRHGWPLPDRGRVQKLPHVVADVAFHGGVAGLVALSA